MNKAITRDKDMQLFPSPNDLQELNPLAAWSSFL